MTDSSPAPAAQTTLIRHILPVIAGGVVVFMLTVVTDNWLSARGLLAIGEGDSLSTGELLLVLLYRGVFAILGCHMAARLAPAGQPRIRYALALGVLLLALNVVGAVSGAGRFPMWYLLLGIALQVPYAIVGGGTAVRAMARAGR